MTRLTVCWRLLAKMLMNNELLPDLGNTRLKWAWRQPEPSSSLMSALTHAAPNNGAGIWDALFLEARPQKVWLASVAGIHADDLTAEIKQRWGSAVIHVRTPAQFSGWTNSYAAPERLGVDRFLAMLGARELAANSSLCVAMAGTALTLDVLDANSTHQGGLIVPGPSLMRASLHRGTAELPFVNASNVSLGRSTADAIGAGSVRACVALIAAVAQDFPAAKLVMSGGAAAELQPGLAAFAPRYVEDLVLRGLRFYAAHQA